MQQQKEGWRMKCLKCDFHGKCPAVLEDKLCPYSEKQRDIQRWATTVIALLALIISIAVLMIRLGQL